MFEIIRLISVYERIHSIVEDDTKHNKRRLFWKQKQKVEDISTVQPEGGTKGKEEMSKVD